MDDYKLIDWTTKTGEEIFKGMDALPYEEHFAFVEWQYMNNPNAEIDWVELFIEYKESLLATNQIDRVCKFRNWYKQKYPEEYIKEYEYVERDIIDYYLYKDNIAATAEHIDYIKSNPAQGIDTVTIRLLYQLIFNGYFDIAVDYAKAVWKPIDESDEILINASYPFINTLYVNHLQEYYEALLEQHPFDESSICKEAIDMGFEDNTEMFNQVFDALKTDINTENCWSRIPKHADDIIIELNIHFLKWMYQNYKLPFIFSDWIWNMLATTKIWGKQKGQENYFYIEVDVLYKHIKGRTDTLFDGNELELFGKVWGLDYVFLFLHQHQFITNGQYDNMIENIKYLRNSNILRSNSELWQHQFVFKWPRTNNYFVDPSEQKMFDQTRGMDVAEAHTMIEKYLSIEFYSDRLKPLIKKLKINLFDYKPMDFPALLEDEIVMPFVKSAPDIGRNDPCICGSGKKYKKCCLNQ